MVESATWASRAEKLDESLYKSILTVMHVVKMLSQMFLEDENLGLLQIGI